MTLEEDILRVIDEMGDMGATAGQIARRLGKSRSSISHYLWVLRKMGKIERVGGNLWVLRAEARERPEGPFEIPLDRFMRLSLEEHGRLQTAAYNACERLITKAFNRGARQVVVCDSRIIYETDDHTDIPSELIRELMREYKRPCYVFTSEDMIEESPWHPIGAEDYYPTIRIFLGRHEWGDERVFSDGHMVYADFDTGNPFYKAFDDELGRGFLRHPEAYEVRLGRHLGFPYRFYVRKVKVGVRDVRGAARCLRDTARFVLSWSESPLCLANPGRRGLVGRDLMLRLPLRLKLDPVARRTALELV